MGKQSIAEPSSLDDLQALAVFVRVVEHRSLTAAGKSLGVSTSSVSKRVARLEDRLGVRLLERTTRRVRLTEAGQTFYERCVAILRAVDDAEAAVTHIGGVPRGTLRLSAPTIFGERHIAPLLPDFLEQHPHLRVDVSFSDRFVNLVEEGFDAAVRIGTLQDSSLKARKLARVDQLVVGSPGYFEARGVPRRPEDLADHECMMYGLTTVAREWKLQKGKRTHTPAVQGRVVMNHGGAIRAAAVAGAGLARLPRFIVDDALRDGSLRSVLDDYAGDPLEIVAVYPAGKQPLPKTQAFIRFLAKRLPERLRC